MTSGINILLRGSLLGRFVSSITNDKALGHNYTISNTDSKYIQSSDISDQEKTENHSISDLIVVSFGGPDDIENPHNWPFWVRMFITVCIALLSCFVYISSIIYFPSKQHLVEQFGISETLAILPLSLFVIAYGFGPLVFSPLSEHPAIGRNLTYVVPLLIFCVLQIPTVLVNNFAGFCILRFISGFMISPALATSGATISDLFAAPYLPIAMSIWGVGSISGISFGPLFGQALEDSTHNWRWAFWTQLIISGFIAVIFLLFVPETYSKAILYQKAKRLRKITGNSKIVLDKDVNSNNFSKETMIEILWRPVVIGLTEPVVFMINIYLGILYAILYLWFECLPIIFYHVHQFSTMAVGASYLAVCVGCVLGCIIYDIILYRSYTLPMLREEKLYPEVFTPVAILGSIILPIGIFITGWTGAADLPWIAPLIGVVLLGTSSIMLFQSLLNYIAMSFPRFVASAFSSNAFARSVLAGCFPLFGKAMFLNLKNERFPVAYGSTILGGISLLLVSVSVTFYIFGPRLRATSKYSGQ